MIGVFAFASAGPAALSGLAGEGAVDFAIFLAFTFGGAGLGVNGAGVNSTGSVAAVLLKQACEVHPQHRLRRVKAAAPGEHCRQTPNEKYSHAFPLNCRVPFAFLAADMVADDRRDRFSTFQRVATI